MTATQDLFYITTNVLEGMKKILTEYQPDILLVRRHNNNITAERRIYANISVGHISWIKNIHLNAPFVKNSIVK